MATFDNEMEPTQQPTQSKGCGMKVLVILGLVFVVMALACCGVGGYFYYTMKPVVTEDPTEVRAKTAEIAEIEVLDGLEPQMAMSMTIPIKNIDMAMVVYSDGTTSSALTMLMFSVDNLSDAEQAEMHRAFEQGTSQHNADGPEGINVEETQEKTIEINGQETTFIVSKGTGQQSGNARIMAVGTFQGKAGLTTVVVNVDAEKYPEEEVVKMLESIK
jgi:hypothetical protein